MTLSHFVRENIRMGKHKGALDSSPPPKKNGSTLL